MEPLPSKIQRFNIFYIILAFWAMVFLYDFFNYKKNTEAIPYSQFLTYVDEDRIAEVTVTSDQIRGQLKESHQDKHPYFTTIRVDDPQLTSKLKEKKIKFQGTLQNDWISFGREGKSKSLCGEGYQGHFQ
jgi:cell division protease FtsH